MNSNEFPLWFASGQAHRHTQNHGWNDCFPPFSAASGFKRINKLVFCKSWPKPFASTTLLQSKNTPSNIIKLHQTTTDMQLIFAWIICSLHVRYVRQYMVYEQPQGFAKKEDRLHDDWTLKKPNTHIWNWLATKNVLTSKTMHIFFLVSQCICLTVQLW